MKPAALVACVFLSLVALAHLLRIVLGVTVTAGTVSIPMWMSAVATVFTAGLAVWLWREQHA
jgi:hypothetical protein